MTPAQLEILRGLSRDQTYRQISLRLGTPQCKVKDQALRTVEELKCITVAGAVATALRRKLID